MVKSDMSMAIPDEKGSYCLLFRLKEPRNITIGKLGNFFFDRGYYFYFGSAKGSGGLRARINRHISMEKKKFWHIDFLRPHLIILAVVFTMEIDKECEWGQTTEAKFGLRMPAKGFGASDCRVFCKAHLKYSPNFVNPVELTACLEKNEAQQTVHCFITEDIT